MEQPVRNLPPCWSNDQRMNWLFSPFRQKESNPVDYQSKLIFWTELLDGWCSECGRATFTIKDLQSAFKRKNVYPSCLETVVNELLKSGDVMSKSNFLSLDPEESWSSWAVKSIVKAPAVWSFNKLKDALFEADPTQIEYVNIKHLKTASSAIVTNCEVEGKNLMSFEEFVSMLNAKNDDEASLILRWLVYKRHASTISDSGSRLIKIGKGPITEAEITVKKLRDTIDQLNRAVDHLEIDKLAAVEETKILLGKNMRESAKLRLRKKKEIDKQIEKKLQTVHNLDSLLCRINDAKTDAEILDSYKIGIKALKNTFANKGLDVDSVANTMSDLEEVCEMHEDIETTLANGIESSTDELELEEELLTLLNAEKGNKPSETSSPGPEIPELPDVPISNPSPEKVSKMDKEMILSP